MKVLFLTNVESPYRVNFFNELGTLCDLTVLFELESASNRNKEWQEEKRKTYKRIMLCGSEIEPGVSSKIQTKQYLMQDFDIIVVGGYYTPTQQAAIKLMSRKKIPFLLNADGIILNKKESLLKKWYKTYLIKKANYYLSSGEATTSAFIHYGAKKENIFLYPFTSVLKADITNQNIDKLSLKKELGITEERIVVSVGSFFKGKGMDAVIRAASRCGQDIGFYIIGGKPTEEYLSLAQGNQRIHFVDHLKKKELKRFYDSADLFVLMTHSDVWGLVVNEAMAAGLPIITTKKCNAGLEMIKDDENGYVIDVNDDIALAEKITKLFENQALLEKMSINNLQKIEYYTIENMARVHYDIFNEILNREQTRV